MKVKLTRDTAVKLLKGEVVEVTEQEARRLVAFRLAEEVKETKKKAAPKKK